MSTVREILRPDPPHTLYHYTTARGLLGIVDTKTIWASHTQYLNDQREFQHAVAIIKEEISKMKRSGNYAKHKGLLEDMENTISDSGFTNVCVCSFSEDGDVLSQWRAYGGTSDGFSVGFRGHFLQSISHAKKFWLVRCIYEEQEQRHWMQALLNDVLNENIQRQLDNDIPPTGGKLAEYVNRYAPILKDKSFAEEKEWRIITRPLSSTQKDFCFRPGRSMLVPYCEIPLGSESQSFEIAEIIVGPTPHSRQSRKSIQSLLEKHGLIAKVNNTKTPYRNW